MLLMGFKCLGNVFKFGNVLFVVLDYDNIFVFLKGLRIFCWLMNFLGNLWLLYFKWFM